MLAALLMAHPHKEDLQLVLSSSKLEDFIHFEGLPHLYSGTIISAPNPLSGRGHSVCARVGRKAALTK